MNPAGVLVRGGATPEEVAAVVAALTARGSKMSKSPSGYALWRTTRLAAVAAALRPGGH